MPLKWKHKMHEVIIRPARGGWTIKSNNIRTLITTKMMMLRMILGVSLLEYIKNGEIRRSCVVDACNGLGMYKEDMNTTSPGVRRRGRLRKMWKQQIREDMREVVVTMDITLDHKEWRRRSRPILCGQGYGPSR